MYGRPARICMVWYRRETCGGPITQDVKHRPIYPLHLPSRTEGRSNTLPSSGNTPVSTKSHITFRGGRQRRHDGVWFRKPEVYSLWYSTFFNGTAVYTSFNYGNVSGHWAIHDRILQRLGGKAPIEDHPGEDGHLSGTIFRGLHGKSLGKADSLYQKYGYGVRF